MTPSEIKQVLADRTGIPRSVVALLLHAQEELLTECILRQETCYIGDMFTIRSKYRNFSVIGKEGERELVNKLAVNVKPRKPLRRSMNNGKVRSTHKHR